MRRPCALCADQEAVWWEQRPRGDVLPEQRPSACALALAQRGIFTNHVDGLFGHHHHRGVGVA